jgi:hypothetical protein
MKGLLIALSCANILVTAFLYHRDKRPVDIVVIVIWCVTLVIEIRR